MHIQWGEGACDYYLTKEGTESTEEVDELTKSRQEEASGNSIYGTDVYDEIISIMDTKFASYDREVFYDESNQLISYYIKADEAISQYIKQVQEETRYLKFKLNKPALVKITGHCSYYDGYWGLDFINGNFAIYNSYKEKLFSVTDFYDDDDWYSFMVLKAGTYYVRMDTDTDYYLAVSYKYINRKYKV